MTRIGFAGLGRMGAPMVRNLARAGFSVAVWNRTARRAEALAAETGCRVVETPAALARSCDVVLAMLADDAASEAVHLGPEGLFSAPGARTFVEMGTMSPDHIAHLAAMAPDGCRVIDAPVSGATQAAEEAALLIMAGCSEQAGADLAPVFDALGRKTIWLGRAGAGTIMKLAVNSLIHGLNQTVSEALVLAERAGIDPGRAFDVIENSAAAAPMLKYRRPLYLDESAHAVTFTVALARKDMEVTLALAGSMGLTMPQGRVTLDILKAAEARSYAQRDMASIVTYMRREGSS